MSKLSTILYIPNEKSCFEETEILRQYFLKYTHDLEEQHFPIF